MALPTLEKTWQISANNRITAGTDAVWYPSTMLAIKNVLVGFATNPLVVVACSDSTVVADYWDGVDRWSVYTDLVWNTAGNAHSWIVLERVDGAQICINLNESTSTKDQCEFAFSANGLFSGGSNTNRPTASDEMTSIQFAQTGSATDVWGIGQGVSNYSDVVFHVWNSTDGLIQRVAIFQLGWNTGFWRLDVMADAPSGLLKPIFASIRVDTSLPINSDCTTPETMHDHQQGRFYANTQSAVLYTSSIDGGSSYGDVWPANDYGLSPNQIDDSISMTELALLSNTVGARGWKGRCVDVWLTSYGAVQNGTTFPANPLTRNFVCVGALVLPWLGDCTGMLTA